MKLDNTSGIRGTSGVRGLIPYNVAFLKYLKSFKGGFVGNEMGVVRDTLSEYELDRRPLNILDVGSGDGHWVSRMRSSLESDIKVTISSLTALDPIINNKPLALVCKEHKEDQHVVNYIETAELPSDHYDLIFLTHSAYYFFSQGLAHKELARVLRNDGLLVVTLVSQECVLNVLTREMLRPYGQVMLTAESYIGLISKIGCFQVERMVSFTGIFDREHYLQDEEHLHALTYILARHRLPERILDQQATILRQKLSQSQMKGAARLNRVLFLRHLGASGGLSDSQIVPVIKQEERAFMEVKQSVLNFHAGIGNIETMIQDSFNNVSPSKNNRELHQHLAKLTELVSELAKQVEQENGEELARDFETFTKELIVEKPRAKILSVIGDQLILQAQRVAQFAEPVSKCVEAIRAIFGV